jgi:hypothetical protein
MPIANVSYSFKDDPWLKELQDKYGDNSDKWGKTIKIPSCIRTCWVWFPEGELFNHHVSIDNHGLKWIITAGMHGNDEHPSTHVSLEIHQSDRPSPKSIRTVLVLAGFLEEE